MGLIHSMWSLCTPSPPPLPPPRTLISYINIGYMLYNTGETLFSINFCLLVNIVCPCPGCLVMCHRGTVSMNGIPICVCFALRLLPAAVDTIEVGISYVRRRQPILRSLFLYNLPHHLILAINLICLTSSSKSLRWRVRKHSSGNGMERSEYHFPYIVLSHPTFLRYTNVT